MIWVHRRRKWWFSLTVPGTLVSVSLIESVDHAPWGSRITFTSGRIMDVSTERNAILNLAGSQRRLG